MMRKQGDSVNTAQAGSPGGAVPFWLGNSVLNPATLMFKGFVPGGNRVTLRLGLLMLFGLGYLINLVSDESDPRRSASGLFLL